MIEKQYLYLSCNGETPIASVHLPTSPSPAVPFFPSDTDVPSDNSEDVAVSPSATLVSILRTQQIHYETRLAKMNRSDREVWNAIVTATHPFQLASLSGIPALRTADLSCFVFWELAHDFHLFSSADRETPMTYVSLSSDPTGMGGRGFQECFTQIRKAFRTDTDNTPPDTIYSLTYYTDLLSVPSRSSSSQVSLSIDHSIVHIDTLDEVCERLSSSGGVDWVTGRGSSSRYREQSTQIFVAEIIVALRTLRSGGHFLVKCVDLLAPSTVDMMCVLTRVFKQVHIVKPYTSHPGYSEFYLVCKGFTGRNEAVDTVCSSWLRSLREIIYQGIHMPLLAEHQFLKQEVPEGLYGLLYNYAQPIIRQQCMTVEKMMNLYQTPSHMQYRYLCKFQSLQHKLRLEWSYKYQQKDRAPTPDSHIKAYK